MSNSSAVVAVHCQDSSALPFSTVYTVVRLLILTPLSIVVVHIGYQRWRQQRSFATTSHSDIFVYHKLAFDFFYSVGTTLFHCGTYLNASGLSMAGLYLAGFDIPAQIQLHVLTCVERYLAVIHPVTYLRLKQSGGVRVRNISISCIWLQVFLWIGLLHYYAPQNPVIAYFLLLAACFIIVSFCSVRALCILIRPGPGDAPGQRLKVDQSKQKAFNTIAIITAIICLFFAGMICSLAIDYSGQLSYDAGCYILLSALWLSMPCNLLLPILFIQRSGKVSRCNWS